MSKSVDGNPLCLARFSKLLSPSCTPRRVSASIRAVISSASSTLVASRHFDVLYPAHEQAFSCWRVFVKRCRRTSPSPCPISRPSCGCRAKISYATVLNELGLTAPPTTIAHNKDANAASRRGACPVYVKAAFGTATQGVHFVHSTGRTRAGDRSAAADVKRASSSSHQSGAAWRG